jgi:hypothetical protein
VDIILSPNWQETPKFPNEGAGQFVSFLLSCNLQLQEPSTEQTPTNNAYNLPFHCACHTNDSGRNQNPYQFSVLIILPKQHHVNFQNAEFQQICWTATHLSLMSTKKKLTFHFNIINTRHLHEFQKRSLILAVIEFRPAYTGNKLQLTRVDLTKVKLLH